MHFRNWLPLPGRRFGFRRLACLAILIGGCGGEEPPEKQGEPGTGLATTAPADEAEARRIARLRDLVENRATTGNVRALAAGGDPQAFELLRPHLRHRSLMVRMSTAVSLGRLGDARAVGPLQEAAASKYSGLRLAAVVGLGELGPPARPAAGQLAAMLEREFEPMHPSVDHLNPDEEHGQPPITRRIHRAVLKSLGRIGGPDARAAAAAVLNAGGGGLHRPAARALAKMGAVQPLVAAGRAGRHEAWKAIGQAGDRSVLPAMLQRLSEDGLSRAERKALLYALGRLKDRRATPALLEALRGSPPGFERAAAWALNAIDDPNALDALIAYVESAPPESPGLYSATCAIGDIPGRKSLDALRQLARHPSDGVQEAVAYKMDQRATADDLPLLVHWLAAADHPPTEALRRLLPESAGPLLNVLPQAAPKVQERILEVLAAHEPARPALRELLKSDHEAVCTKAYRLLWEQRDPAVGVKDMLQRRLPMQVDQRDAEALEELVRADWKRTLCLMHLFRADPNRAWPYVREHLIRGDMKSLNIAGNCLTGELPAWVAGELIGLLQRSDELPTATVKKVLGILTERECLLEGAQREYFRLAEHEDQLVRLNAYEALAEVASDKAMALIARKALAGDRPAKWIVGRTRDARLAGAFEQLVQEAIADKKTWVGGYVHCWPMAEGVKEYIDEVGANYAKIAMEKRRVLRETAPE
jgi:HEAT repeat protein